jgi:hypothetical protein
MFRSFFFRRRRRLHKYKYRKRFKKHLRKIRDEMRARYKKWYIRYFKTHDINAYKKPKRNLPTRITKTRKRVSHAYKTRMRFFDMLTRRLYRQIPYKKEVLRKTHATRIALQYNALASKQRRMLLNYSAKLRSIAPSKHFLSRHKYELSNLKAWNSCISYNFISGIYSYVKHRLSRNFIRNIQLNSHAYNPTSKRRQNTIKRDHILVTKQRVKLLSNKLLRNKSRSYKLLLNKLRSYKLLRSKLLINKFKLRSNKLLLNKLRGNKLLRSKLLRNHISGAIDRFSNVTKIVLGMPCFFYNLFYYCTKIRSVLNFSML